MATQEPNLSPLKMLIVGNSNAPGDMRAEFLCGHGVEVDVAATTDDARAAWKPNAYRWVLIDVRKHLPDKIMEFCEGLRKQCPEQKIAFWVGPPNYLVFTWPEATALGVGTSREQEEWAAELASAA